MNVFCQLIGFGALIAMGLSYWQDETLLSALTMPAMIGLAVALC